LICPAAIYGWAVYAALLPSGVLQTMQAMALN
jgi:hypothetical protein